jgi:hypothetical protein
MVSILSSSRSSASLRRISYGPIKIGIARDQRGLEAWQAMSDEVRIAIIDRRTREVVKISRPLPGVATLFTLPPPNTVLWKFGDYWKFAQLFAERTLYFRRADKLPDVLEGKFTAANQERRSDMFDAAFADLQLGNAAPILRIQESNRTRTFLHCWHKNEDENPRMWKEYTTTADSIALVTDLTSLFKATPEQCKGAEVHYVAEDQPLPELHSLAALVHKRREPYAFENEFRLIYQLPPGESIYLDRAEDYFRLVPVDPGTLVHRVLFHPEAAPEFKARVRADLAAAKLWIPASDSHFAES